MAAHTAVFVISGGRRTPAGAFFYEAIGGGAVVAPTTAVPTLFAGARAGRPGTPGAVVGEGAPSRPVLVRTRNAGPQEEVKLGRPRGGVGFLGDAFVVIRKDIPPLNRRVCEIEHLETRGEKVNQLDTS